MQVDQPEGERVTRPRITRRTVWFSSLSLLAIGTAGLAATYTRGDEAVRYGTVIGALGALRTVLPSVEKKYGLKYDMKDFRDATSTLLALDQGELDLTNANTISSGKQATTTSSTGTKSNLTNNAVSGGGGSTGTGSQVTNAHPVSSSGQIHTRTGNGPPTPPRVANYARPVQPNFRAPPPPRVMQRQGGGGGGQHQVHH